MRWWKVLGVAGFVGIAASGALVARAERRRRSYTPEEIRDRLRARHDRAGTGADPDGTGAAGGSPAGPGS